MSLLCYECFWMDFRWIIAFLYRGTFVQNMQTFWVKVPSQIFTLPDLEPQAPTVPVNVNANMNTGSPVVVVPLSSSSAAAGTTSFGTTEQPTISSINHNNRKYTNYNNEIFYFRLVDEHRMLIHHLKNKKHAEQWLNCTRWTSSKRLTVRLSADKGIIRPIIQVIEENLDLLQWFFCAKNF